MENFVDYFPPGINRMSEFEHSKAFPQYCTA